jgi:hypothetical protein
LTTHKMTRFNSSRVSPYVDMTGGRRYRFRRNVLITYQTVR